MDEFGSKEKRSGNEEIFSKSLRAGKRTYFFDVKPTKGNDYYLTITESKRKFDSDLGKFVYEKHKLFLYKEDFGKFVNNLNEVMDRIEMNDFSSEREEFEEESKETTTVEFEDLEISSELKI